MKCLMKIPNFYLLHSPAHSTPPTIQSCNIQAHSLLNINNKPSTNTQLERDRLLRLHCTIHFHCQSLSDNGEEGFGRMCVVIGL
jgi:hypothetical protein